MVDGARSQTERGDEVLVACSAAGPLSGELAAAGVPVVALADSVVKRRFDLGYAVAIRRLAARTRPDVIHAHLYASIVASAAATCDGGFPLVVTEQTEAPWRSRSARLASRLAYLRATEVIAVSDRIADGLVRDFGVPAAKVTTVPNAVTLPGCAPGPGVALRGRPVFGVCARLVAEKGVDVFLEAASRLARSFPDATFPIVGDGPLRSTLERRAGELGLRDRVVFLGFRSDARDVVAGFDVLVLPSRSEGTPLTVVEAMHAGVPVVASAVGGIPEQIVDGNTGLLVPPDDPAALARAMACVAGDGALAGRLAEAGRRHAHTRFHPDAMLGRLDAVYASALARERPSGRRLAGGARRGHAAWSEGGAGSG